MKKDLLSIYRRLYSSFGPQHWWPADSPFEVMVGAILTQNTNWQNVERAIRNLKKNSVLSPKKLDRLSIKYLARLIRPSGYYNIKAKRLKEYLKFFLKSYGGKASKMSKAASGELRGQLLSVKGIGPETADSILLYALDKPVFVVDSYTKRIMSRHGLIKEDSDYDAVQSLFTRNLKHNVKLFNEYHALLVKLAKDYCLKRSPKCETCPLR